MAISREEFRVWLPQWKREIAETRKNMANQEMAQMRECLKDLADSGVFSNLNLEDVDTLSDSQVLAGVKRHYGLDQFRHDYMEVR